MSLTAVTDWIPKWIQNGQDGEWVTSTGKPPGNEDLLRELHRVATGYSYALRWVCMAVHFSTTVANPCSAGVCGGP